MDLTICVSPEAGWGNWKFLGRDQGAPHCCHVSVHRTAHFRAVSNAVTPEGREFELVLHPIPEKPPKAGVKANDLNEQNDVIDPLEKDIKDRFKMAWATLKTKAHPDGLWASAYHIKVAVRDGKALWLSSGNWQSSNQPDVHPFGDQARSASARLPAQVQPRLPRHRRERKLAPVYETYIKRDYELSSAQAASPAFAAPDLFVPKRKVGGNPRVRGAPAVIQAAAARTAL